MIHAVVILAALGTADVERLPVTAYCDRGRTASGCMAGPGQCAVPRDVPLGSRVYVDGVWLRATDHYNRRLSRRIDLWRPTRAECLKRGIVVRTVTFAKGRRR